MRDWLLVDPQSILRRAEPNLEFSLVPLIGESIYP